MDRLSTSTSSKRLLPPQRVALATGAARFPGMDYVLDQSAHFGNYSLRLFAYAVESPDPLPVSHVQALDALPLPYHLRRRTYPATRGQLIRELCKWRPKAINLHFMSLGGFAAKAADKASRPLVTTVHAMEPHLLTRPETRRERYLRADCTQVLEGTSVFVAVSHHIKRWLMSLGVPASKIVVNYVGVNTDFWRPIPNAGRTDRAIAFVGHLSALKGVLDVVRASVSLRASTPHLLHVVGDGPLGPEVQEFARHNPHIRVHGRLLKPEIRRILAESTVLAMPTKPDQGIEEAAGMVLLEAQAMGVPVASYRTGGVPEMLPPGYPMICEPGDVTTLTDLLQHALRMNADEQRQLGNDLRVWVVANRSLNAGAARMEDILDRAIGAPAVRTTPRGTC